MLTPATPLASGEGLVRQIGLTGCCTFLLTARREVTGRTETRVQLRLEDCTSQTIGLIRPEILKAAALPPLPMPVSLLATVVRHAGQAMLEVLDLARADPDQVGCATSLLPIRYCPPEARYALFDVAGLEMGLPTPLNGFLKRVLLDARIALPFLNCRASAKHHHHYPGGLLVHSTEALSMVRTCAEQILPEDSWAPHLAQLAYFLHDLGKIRTVGTTFRPQYAFAASHELLTIELLAPHLQWLERHGPKLAAGLRYVLAYLALPHWARPALPRYEIAKIVEQFDQWSAASFDPRDLTHLLRPPHRDAGSTPARISGKPKHCVPACTK